LIKAACNLNAVDVNGMSALMIGILNKHAEVALDLIKSGCNTLIQDNQSNIAS